MSFDSQEKIWTGPVAPEPYYRNNISIGEIVFEELRRHPNNIAQISYPDKTVLSNADILENAKRIASFLRNINIGQDDFVGIIAKNCTHLSAVAFACAFNGTVFHVQNSEAEKETIKEVYGLTQAKVIFCDGGENYWKIKDATNEVVGNVQIITMNEHISGVQSILDILEGTTPHENFQIKIPKTSLSSKILAIVCTSGTSGPTPKAATVPNDQRVFQSKLFTSSDVLYSVTSIGWITGLRWFIVSAIYGLTLVISDKPFEPFDFLNAIEEHKINYVFVWPWQINELSYYQELSAEKLDSVRAIFFGGAKCSQKAVQNLKNHLNNGTMIEMYGMTEASGAFTRNFQLNEKPDSVGRLINGWTLKIIDDKTGERLGPNEIGEIYFHKEIPWTGYYNNIMETQQIQDKDGWIRTGDLGYMDEDQFLYVVDRKKDLLRSMKWDYYPSEIEKIITEIPGVAEVCVFGIFDEFECEIAAAAIVKRPDCISLSAQDVIEYVASRVNASYKQLHAGVIFVDKLKRNKNGKVIRYAMKDDFLSFKRQQNGN